MSSGEWEETLIHPSPAAGELWQGVTGWAGVAPPLATDGLWNPLPLVPFKLLTVPSPAAGKGEQLARWLVGGGEWEEKLIHQGPGPVYAVAFSGWRCNPSTLHPTPCTLHPTPYTLYPTPYTLHPAPYTLHPAPYTLNPQP